MILWQHMRITVAAGGVGEEYVLTPNASELGSNPRLVGRVESVDLLNELGSLGWELVSASENPEQYWLKRPGPDTEYEPSPIMGVR